MLVGYLWLSDEFLMPEVLSFENYLFFTFDSEKFTPTDYLTARLGLVN
jgi:hypothetical protein